MPERHDTEYRKGLIMNAGIYGREITRGTKINGLPVVAMARGVRDHQQVVTVRFETCDRRGRKRLSAPVTYPANARVPGTAAPTTWAMPAGPVERKPGGKLHGGWYGDGDDNSRQGRADRHARMIDSLVYA